MGIRANVITFSLDKFSERELRKHMRELVAGVRKIEEKIHPEAMTLSGAAKDYLEEIEDHAAARHKVGRKGEIPERIQQQFDVAKKAYNDARSAARQKLK